MLARIRHLLAALSPAERRVADWLLAHSHDVPQMSLAALAAAAGVSDPTVLRFCRRIGYAGFKDFKLGLAQELASATDFLHAEVNSGDTAAAVVNKVIGANIRELQRVARLLNAERLQQAAREIAAARRVVFAGVGASAIVATDAHNKFFRLGLATSAFTDEPTILQAAATCDASTVLVAISRAGASSALVEANQLAATGGARCIALTAPGSALAASAALSLYIDVDEDTTAYTPMSSRLAQLAVLDALQILTAMAAGSDALRHLQASKAALRA